MRNLTPVYAILLGIYPVIDLYSLLPGGVPLFTIVRPLFLQVLISLFVFLLFYLRRRDVLQAGFLAGITVFYFSSTGYFYRSLPFPVYPAILHLVVVILGIAIVAIFTHPIMWQKYLILSRLRALTSYLNLISIIVLLFPLYRIGKALVEQADDTRRPWSQLILQDQAPQVLKPPSQPPDIYYIILDGYGRQDTIENIFGYDNQAFMAELEHLGFFIAEDARSNYIRTAVSLPSSLNLNYLNFAEEAAGAYSTNYLPLRGLIQDNYARALLEQAGYTTVAISSDYDFTDWKDADAYLSPFENDLSEIERVFYGSTALGALYDPEFPFTEGLRSILPLPSYGTRRAKILFAFEQLKKIPQIPGPKFVFVHIIAPHPPFVFDADGKPVPSGRPYNPGDGEGFTGGPEEYQALYVEQLQFINKQVLRSIQQILHTSPNPPVILIQGDHGSGSLMNSSIEQSCMYERTSILSAYYMPEGRTELLYPAITPVNSFRVVFNTYFGADFPLLPDQTYFSPFVNPYDFVDITERIETECR